MTFNSYQPCFRNGLVARQVVLFIIFAIVLAGGIFEFAWSRPAFQAAWEKIEEVDSSAVSSEFTAEEFEALIGKQPISVDDSQPGIEVRTYRWPSGLPLRPHDIHVVYTKITGLLAEKNPELAGDLRYYSASGGMALTEDNFPPERPTIVLNRNPPSRAGSGGGGPPRSPDLVVGSSEEPPADGSADGKGQPDPANKDGSDKKDSDDSEKQGDANKLPPENVENPADSGKADPPKAKTEESSPKGGEPVDEKPGEAAETPKPESGSEEEGGTGEEGVEGSGA